MYYWIVGFLLILFCHKMKRNDIVNIYMTQWTCTGKLKVFLKNTYNPLAIHIR